MPRLPKFEKMEYDFTSPNIVEPFIKECVHMGWRDASVESKYAGVKASKTTENTFWWTWNVTVGGFSLEAEFYGEPGHAALYFKSPTPIKAHQDDDELEQVQCGVSIDNNAKKIVWRWNSQKNDIRSFFETLEEHVARENRNAARRRR